MMDMLLHAGANTTPWIAKVSPCIAESRPNRKCRHVCDSASSFFSDQLVHRSLAVVPFLQFLTNDCILDISGNTNPSSD